MKTLKTLKAELLADPKTLAEYETLADEFDMARELIAARGRAGLTQREVAQRMGTTQSVVARGQRSKGGAARARVACTPNADWGR